MSFKMSMEYIFYLGSALTIFWIPSYLIVCLFYCLLAIEAYVRWLCV